MMEIVGMVTAIISLLPLFGFAQSISQPSQLSGWMNLRACVTNAIVGNGIEDGINSYVGCQNYVCACNDARSGATVSEIAGIYCGDSSAGATAASVWNSFCSELDSSPTPTSLILPATTSSALPKNTQLITTTTPSSPQTTSFTGMSTQLSQPSQLPGWTDLRACVTNAVAGGGLESGILQYVGCHDYVCACNDPGSEATLSEVASIYCSDSAAAATATSVWDSFCSILLGETAISTMGVTTSQSSTDPTSSLSVSGSSQGGLALGDKIALGLGIPSLIAALIGAYYTWRAFKESPQRNRWGSQW